LFKVLALDGSVVIVAALSTEIVASLTTVVVLLFGIGSLRERLNNKKIND